MTDLFAADVRRILWRPLTRAFALVAVLAIATAGVVVFVRTGGSHPFRPRTGLRSATLEAATPLAFAGFVLGASLFGADYSSRSLTTLLTWEPRRRRVITSRAAACAAVTTGVSLAALALLSVALLPAALEHGNGDVLANAWYLSMTSLAVRCAFLAAAVSVIGVSCAAIGRSTATALAIAAAYWLAIEQPITGLSPPISRWLFVADARSWVVDNPHLSISPVDGQGAGHTVVTAGLVLLAAVLALHATATATLRRRDIA